MLAFVYAQPLIVENIDDTSDIQEASSPGDDCDVGDLENNFGLYLPHPEDCHSFLKCDNRVLVAVRCAADLVWNVDLTACDFSWNVTCTDGQR